MKMRTGLVAGAAIGYYLGSKAGRQRYDQLSKIVKQARRAGSVTTSIGKAKAIAELSVERARDMIGVAKEQYDERGGNPVSRGVPSLRNSNDSRLPHDRMRLNGHNSRSYL